MEIARKIRVGKVISTKMQKTVVVGVELQTKHPLYGKMMRRTVKYKAHNEKLKCKPGDTVKIIETRPISKEKCWKVLEIVRKGDAIGVKPGEITTEEASGPKK